MNRFRIAISFAVLIFYSHSASAQNPCPPGLPPGSTCFSGQDTNGAYFLIARPPNYNRQLVLWNHGYTLNPPAPLGASDLGPAAAFMTLGFAAAASSYRPDTIGVGGWAVKDGAEDTNNLRLRAIDLLGPPSRTFVVGASEGGLITAEIAELYGSNPDGTLNYDGAMPICGPLAGGRKNWHGGFDLRVVYQYYCNNLPRPSEPQYPLYLGLAPGNTLSKTDVENRINECTGVRQPPSMRSPEQAQNLANILNVTTTPEGFLLTDMGFATFALQELAQVRTRGMSPVTNIGVVYQGSTDDNALNAGVYRAAADVDADAFLASAYDPTGQVAMPILTLHTIGDGLVVVENENAYQQTFTAAGFQDSLQQNYVNADGHCQFTNSEVLAAFQSLIGWVDTHTRPSRQDVYNLCQRNTLLFGDTCNINLIFEPDDITTRIPAR